jgi:hypothetical protein
MNLREILNTLKLFQNKTYPIIVKIKIYLNLFKRLMSNIKQLLLLKHKTNLKNIFVILIIKKF